MRAAAVLVLFQAPLTLPSVAQGSCGLCGLGPPAHAASQYGAISARAAGMLDTPAVAHHFARCIQRVMPKSYVEAMKEVTVTRDFLYNFSGDGVRFLARGFSSPGNHMGQTATGTRWPYGPVAIISPFNFPLEIPALQMMGALYMGNKPLIKNAEKTSMVLEQFIRLLVAAGMPASDVDMIHCSGSVASELLRRAPVRGDHKWGREGGRGKKSRWGVTQLLSQSPNSREGRASASSCAASLPERSRWRTPALTGRFWALMWAMWTTWRGSQTKVSFIVLVAPSPAALIRLQTRMRALDKSAPLNPSSSCTPTGPRRILYALFFFLGAPASSF